MKYIFALVLLMTTSVFSKDMYVDLQISQMVSFLNSKKTLKDAFPEKIKNLDSFDRKKLTSLLAKMGDTEMPYFSSLGRSLTTYDKSGQTVNFYVVTFDPLQIVTEDKTYNFEPLSKLLDQVSVSSGTKTSLLQTLFFSEAYAGKRIGALVDTALIGYAGYKVGKYFVDKDKNDKAKFEALNAEIERIKNTANVTGQANSSENVNQANQNLAIGLNKMFPNATCDKSDAAKLSGIKVSYEAKNNVLTMGLSSKDAGGKKLEYRSNEITGAAIWTFCDDKKSCTELNSEQLHSSVTGHHFLPEERKEKMQKLSKLLKEIDKLRNENFNQGQISVEKYMKDKEIKYAKATSHSSFANNILSKGKMEALYKKYQDDHKALHATGLFSKIDYYWASQLLQFDNYESLVSKKDFFYLVQSELVEQGFDYPKEAILPLPSSSRTLSDVNLVKSVAERYVREEKAKHAPFQRPSSTESKFDKRNMLSTSDFENYMQDHSKRNQENAEKKQKNIDGLLQKARELTGLTETEISDRCSAYDRKLNEEGWKTQGPAHSVRQTTKLQCEQDFFEQELNQKPAVQILVTENNKLLDLVKCCSDSACSSKLKEVRLASETFKEGIVKQDQKNESEKSAK
jgi:hypothetical protein